MEKTNLFGFEHLLMGREKELVALFEAINSAKELARLLNGEKETRSIYHTAQLILEGKKRLGRITKMAQFLDIEGVEPKDLAVLASALLKGLLSQTPLQATMDAIDQKALKESRFKKDLCTRPDAVLKGMGIEASTTILEEISQKAKKGESIFTAIHDMRLDRVFREEETLKARFIKGEISGIIPQYVTWNLQLAGAGRYDLAFLEDEYMVLFNKFATTGLNFHRTWILDPVGFYQGYGEHYSLYLSDRSGRYNPFEINPAFLDHLENFVSYAWNRNIIIQITFFDRCSCVWEEEWQQHPWNPERCQINLFPDGTPEKDEDFPFFYDLGNFRLRAAQEYLIGTICQRLRSYPNIIYEIINEGTGTGDNFSDWLAQKAQWIKSHDPDTLVTASGTPQNGGIIQSVSQLDFFSIHYRQWWSGIAKAIDDNAEDVTGGGRKPVLIDDDGGAPDRDNAAVTRQRAYEAFIHPHWGHFNHKNCYDNCPMVADPDTTANDLVMAAIGDGLNQSLRERLAAL